MAWFIRIYGIGMYTGAAFFILSDFLRSININFKNCIMQFSLKNISGTAGAQPYDNAGALNELLRMMRNGERLDVRFSTDQYGHPRARIESSKTDYFYLLLNQEITTLVFDYLYCGESDIVVENPSKIESDKEATRSSFELEMFKQMVEQNPKDMQRVPAFRDKPGYISAHFRYSWGKIFFRVEQTPELEELIAEHLPKRN